MLFLKPKILLRLLRSLFVRRNLVKSSAHHAADYSLLEVIHGFFFVIALLDEVF